MLLQFHLYNSNLSLKLMYIELNFKTYKIDLAPYLHGANMGVTILYNLPSLNNFKVK